jgi:hypothetical protein
LPAPVANDLKIFQKSITEQKEITSKLATETLGSMQALAAYQDDPIIQHYGVDMNNTGKFLYYWVYQIESEVTRKPSKISNESSLNSCKLVAATVEKIQKNQATINKFKAEAHTRLNEAEVLVKSFLTTVKNDTNFEHFLILNPLGSPYENLIEVIDTIKDYFLLETPGLIARFAEAFANIYVSLNETVSLYDEYYLTSVNNSQIYLETYKRNC